LEVSYNAFHVNRRRGSGAVFPGLALFSGVGGDQDRRPEFIPCVV